MYKLLLLCSVYAITLTACEKQKASAEADAIHKQIIDQATNDINKAEALAAEKMKPVESELVP